MKNPIDLNSKSWTTGKCFLFSLHRYCFAAAQHFTECSVPSSWHIQTGHTLKFNFFLSLTDCIESQNCSSGKGPLEVG